jgi:hypothetical protein
LRNFLNNFNWVAIVTGILISLLLTIILKLIIGNPALWILPVLTGFMVIFLANETEYLSVGISSLIAGLITVIWVGPLFIILAPLGGCLGALLNSYLSKGVNLRNLSKRSTADDSRVMPIQNWISHPQTNKLVPVVATIILGVILVWGLSAVTFSDTDVPKTKSPSNNITINPDEILKNNVKIGVESFFKNFNTIFDQNGVSNGYIISTIKIDNLTKISATEVNVTVSLTRKTNTGETLYSVWSGPFYLVNGTWVDKGDFVPIKSSNNTTTQ